VFLLGVEEMRDAYKRDWEMIRIFLILAALTIGFVWGMQGFILTPSATARAPASQPAP
jgi:hypothetical protein